MSWPAPCRSPLTDHAVGPLDGVRVLDFSPLLPGPFCTLILADLGADVIKVEPPEGDGARRHAARPFPVANRNKRAITINLKDPDERRRCLQLAEHADVVVEGYRPGVVDRLGIGYPAMKELRPDVIYCSISGYGQSGPSRDRPGHELTYLAASGGLSYSGHWGEPPRRGGVPVGDLAASSYATIAILSALMERGRTGAGCHLDVSIHDTAMAFASVRGGPNFEISNEHQLGLLPSNDVYSTRDGQELAIAAVETKFWNALREALSDYVGELSDPRFDDEDGRRQHGDELKALIAKAFRQRDADDWLRTLTAVDVPVERVVTLAGAARGPQAVARGIVKHLGDDRQVVFPVRRDGQVMGRFTSPAPELGQHNEEVLGRGEPLGHH